MKNFVFLVYEQTPVFDLAVWFAMINLNFFWDFLPFYLCYLLTYTIPNLSAH